MRVSWNRERLGSLPVIVVALVATLVGLGVAIAAVSDVDHLLAGLLAATAITAIGAAAGSIVSVGAGIALFGAITAVGEPGPALMAITGVVALAVLAGVDEALSLRRTTRLDLGPAIDRARTTALVALAGAACSLTAWFLATRATWSTIVLPLAILAVGLAARLATPG